MREATRNKLLFKTKLFNYFRKNRKSQVIYRENDMVCMIFLKMTMFKRFRENPRENEKSFSLHSCSGPRNSTERLRALLPIL
jgi:hypothetical protein